MVDKYGSAIWKLAEMVKRENSHFNIDVFPVHPKRNSPEVLFEAQQKIRWADLIDIHYWKSGEVVRMLFPVDFEKRKRIVCHFNPYDIDKVKWLDIYQEIVVGNQDIHQRIPYSILIPYGVDLDFFEFSSKMSQEKVVNMVVGRIEGKKGVREVAEVCQKLGYKFVLVGRVSDINYMRSVIAAGKESIEFIENVTEEKLREVYYRSMVHVCNSIDEFESGTLPILEAMACGVPVLTRNVGHVPDLFNGSNMVVRKGKESDVVDLEKELKELVENEERRKKIRESAFKSIKNRYHKKMARQFSRLYYDVLNKSPLVSIIVPTKDRGLPLLNCLAKAVNQSYKNCEVVIADSGEFPVEDVVRKLRGLSKVPIKYIRFQSDHYSLAEARNRAVIEAQGEILVFCDDRLEMDEKSVEEFVKLSKSGCWLWGVKDEYEKPFVENFSSVKREDLIKGGMFNERVMWYGGMSEEIRSRFSKEGFAFELVKTAKAKSVVKSGDRDQKRKGMIQSKFLLYKLYS